MSSTDTVECTICFAQNGTLATLKN